GSPDFEALLLELAGARVAERLGARLPRPQLELELDSAWQALADGL
ncbi:MAG: hypothetical protein QG573_1039, partial [Acidobacteriota bacterium]|nr:hypothetical protein [Acidobacteriota bacterium]